MENVDYSNIGLEKIINHKENLSIQTVTLKIIELLQKKTKIQKKELYEINNDYRRISEILGVLKWKKLIKYENKYIIWIYEIPIEHPIELKNLRYHLKNKNSFE